MDIRKTLVVAVQVWCIGAGIYLAWILLNLLYSYEPLYAIGVSSFLAVLISVAACRWYIAIDRLCKGAEHSTKFVLVSSNHWDQLRKLASYYDTWGSQEDDPVFISFSKSDLPADALRKKS